MHPLLAKEAFSCLQPRNHASGKSNAIHHLSDITASYMYAKLFRGTPWNVLSRYCIHTSRLQASGYTNQCDMRAARDWKTGCNTLALSCISYGMAQMKV